MASYLLNGEKKNCSFCRACISACPVSAISAEKDEDGFLFPVTDKDKCINCSKCFNVCPFSDGEKIPAQEQEYYACKVKDDKTRFLSSSGGAFSEIAECFCNENYVLFGAVIDSDLKVRHAYTKNIKNLGDFRKSKYVQSDIGDSFIKAKQFLESGKKVLFSGTPCQIAGFKNFLGKEYENLLCIDIVCHGVPSQELFDKYISELSDELSEKIVKFTFRNKDGFYGRKCNQKTVLIETESGKKYTKQVLECEYLAAFHEAMFYRESCAQCPFASSERVGDITLGDFWGIEDVDKDFDDGRGVSLLIFNTPAGKKLLPLLEERTAMLKAEKEQAVKKNAQLRRPVKPHENRDKFFKLNREKSFCESVRGCMFIPSPFRLKLYNASQPVKKLLKKLK